MSQNDDPQYQNHNTYGGFAGVHSDDPSKSLASSADQATTRYQQMGAQANNRQAAQADQSGYTGGMAQSQDSRTQQMGALGQMQAARNQAASAAMGQQPSQAQILGQQMNQQALRGQMAAAGSARGGPMAQAAAQQSAAGNAAQQTAQAQQSQMAARAGEMAQARGQYIQATGNEFAGASGVRQGDQSGAALGLQKSGQDLQNEQFQRQLNQQGQEHYEDMGQQVTEDQLKANQNAQQEADQAWNQGRQNTLASEHEDHGITKDIIGGISGAASGALGGLGDIFSDERVKTNVSPMGGVGDMKLGGGMDLAGGTQYNPGGTTKLGPGGGSMDVMGSLKANNDAAMGFMKQGGGAAPGLMRSDERCKLEAAMADNDGATPYAPQGELGAMGVRRGYAASREGEPGAIGAPPTYHGYEPDPAARQVGRNQFETDKDAKGGDLAPGTSDVERYGKVAEGEPDWRHGGADAKAKPTGNKWLGALSGMFGGVRGQRDTTKSDERAKQEAYALGRASGKEDTMKRVGEMQGMHPQELARLSGQGPSNDGRMASMVRQQMPAQEMERPLPRSVEYTSRTPGVPDTGGAPSIHKTGFVRTGPQMASSKAPPSNESQVDAVPEGGWTDQQILEAAEFNAKPKKGTSAATQAESMSALQRIRERMKAVTTGTGSAGAEVSMRSDEHAKEQIHGEESMREANLSMAPSSYKYKPQFTPPGQKTGEVNVGPIAQNMARSPVAKTAIVKEPDGLLAIDKEKGLKLVMGGLASLQHQVDALAGAHGKRAR